MLPQEVGRCDPEERRYLGCEAFGRWIFFYDLNRHFQLCIFNLGRCVIDHRQRIHDFSILYRHLSLFQQRN